MHYLDISNRKMHYYLSWISFIHFLLSRSPVCIGKDPVDLTEVKH